MADDEEVPTGPTDSPEPEADDDVELEASEISTDAKGNKLVSLSAMLRYKKEAKANARRVKELEPIAASATDINERLGKAQPIIDAILTNPRLRAEALRAVNGTRTSNEQTDQPQNDPDAEQFAEINNMYLPDGQTLDVARAQRSLALMDKRHGRQTDDKMRPLAGTVLGSRADQNVRAAIEATDDDGVPLASEASIRETVAMMGGDGAYLLAKPEVVDMLLNNAIGLDRRKGRTPKAPEEPLYMAPAGGGRGRRTDVIDSDTRAILQRQGISEKDYLASSKRLEEGVANRKGIALGGKN